MGDPSARRVYAAGCCTPDDASMRRRVALPLLAHQVASDAFVRWMPQQAPRRLTAKLRIDQHARLYPSSFGKAARHDYRRLLGLQLFKSREELFCILVAEAVLQLARIVKLA